MFQKKYLVQIMMFFIMVGTSDLCMAAAQGQVYRQAAVSSQHGSDITQIQTSLNEINAILESVLGKDSHRQARLVGLRVLSDGGKTLRNSIRSTLKKSVYDFTPIDIENIRILSQAINANQAIMKKRLWHSTFAEFPDTAKQQLNNAINSILKYSKILSVGSSRASRSKASIRSVKREENAYPENEIKSNRGQISDEILMQPIFSEHLSFDYNGRTTNQLTPIAMCFVDLEFFRQTGGGGEVALMRNIGTLKLLLLAYAQVIKGINVYQLTNETKEDLSNSLLNQELLSFPAEERTFTNEKINEIYDRTRTKILAKTVPYADCKVIQKRFGLN